MLLFLIIMCENNYSLVLVFMTFCPRSKVRDFPWNERVTSQCGPLLSTVWTCLASAYCCLFLHPSLPCIKPIYWLHTVIICLNFLKVQFLKYMFSASTTNSSCFLFLFPLICFFFSVSNYNHQKICMMLEPQEGWHSWVTSVEGKCVLLMSPAVTVQAGILYFFRTSKSEKNNNSFWR